MRENCTSGSEGGGIETNRSSLPLSRGGLEGGRRAHHEIVDGRQTDGVEARLAANRGDNVSGSTTIPPG